MFESLVQDVQIVILLEVPFSIGRGINKYFKSLADKIELERDKHILITEDMILKFLNSDTSSFSYMVKYNDGGRSYFKYRKILNRYHLCRKGNCIGESCQCNDKELSYSIDEIKTQLQNSHIRQLIMPGYDIINFLVLNHPLALDNKKFVVKRLKSTIAYYINIMQSLNSDQDFYIEGFLKILCSNLNINHNKLNLEEIKGLIFDKINNTLSD